MSIRPISVAQLNTYVKSLLEGDPNLKPIWLRGELSNFVRNAKSGHCYFTVKDRDASVKAVMFKWQASSLSFLPKDGVQVLLCGKVTLYERDGQYQLQVDRMLPDGLGALYLEFQRVRELLMREGLFDRKKPLPALPSRIGICTSLTGAAVRDVLSVCSRLAPSVRLCVYPCLMQGAQAPDSVREGLEYFKASDPPDLVIVARGGGSYEDLAVFNDEALARYVAQYPIPLISAVGHETDVTILDFVADMRAATPSVAAELAVGQANLLAERFSRARRSVSILAESRLRAEQERLRGLMIAADPAAWIENRAQNLDSLDFRIRNAMNHRTDLLFASFSRITGRLSALNPLSVLSRGYALAEKDGVPIRSADEISSGDRIDLNFYDGVIGCVADCKKIRKL